MANDGRESTERVVGVGQTLYTADGQPVGTVRGVDEDGLFVSARDDVGSFSVEHVRAGRAFGEAELIWRCTECGEVGQLAESLPDACPNCGAEREALMYSTED